VVGPTYLKACPNGRRRTIFIIYIYIYIHIYTHTHTMNILKCLYIYIISCEGFDALMSGPKYFQKTTRDNVAAALPYMAYIIFIMCMLLLL
jgi:hypothetical protein